MVLRRTERWHLLRQPPSQSPLPPPLSTSVTPQVIIPKAVADDVGGLSKVTPTGTSLLIEGRLEETPEGKKQVAPEKT